MDSAAVVYDISSDEEDVVKPLLPSPIWVSREMGADAVAVVDELSCAAVAVKVCSGFLNKTNGSGCVALGEDDDDCVVLEGDPEKPPIWVQAKEAEFDDLLIVGEKGQIACRDYPHPRHLCAVFPFNNTPHKSHCTQCHCYVCDTVAPCFKWGNGCSSMDHCHATDKLEYWKQQRNTLKVPSIAEWSRVPANGSLSTVHSRVLHAKMHSTMQYSHSSGQRHHVRTLPMTQPLGVCTTGISRAQNPVHPSSKHQPSALVQANQSCTYGAAASKTLMVAQASHIIQKQSQVRTISPFCQPTHHNPPGTSYHSIVNARSTVSEQGQGLSFNNRHSLHSMHSAINQQSPAAASFEAYVPVVPLDIPDPSLVGGYRSDISSATPAINYHSTASVHQQNQQARLHPGRIQPPADRVRLNEIMAGLESALGLPHMNNAANFNHSGDPLMHMIRSPLDMGSQYSQACYLPSANLDSRQTQAIPITHQNLDSRSSPMALRPQQVQVTKSLISPPDDIIRLEDTIFPSQVSNGEQQRTPLAPVPTDPGVLQSEPPNLVFDFEDALLGL